MKFLENVKILKVAKIVFFAKHFRPINILDRLLIAVNLSTAILMLGSQDFVALSRINHLLCTLNIASENRA